MQKFRKLQKHPLDVQMKLPPWTKVYYRELVRERVCFIGMGITLGAGIGYFTSLAAGVGPGFFIAVLAGTAMTLLNLGANPNGDLR